MNKSTKYYVLRVPNSIEYLQYNGSKQEFSTVFTMADATIISTEVIVGRAQDKECGTSHKALLREQLQQTYRHHYSQRDLLINCDVIEVDIEMVRKINRKNPDEPPLPVGSYLL